MKNEKTFLLHITKFDTLTTLKQKIFPLSLNANSIKFICQGNFLLNNSILLSNRDFKELFSQLSRSITRVSFNSSRLFELKTIKIECALPYLPETVTEMDFSRSSLGLKKGQELANIFESLSDSIIKINLSLNNLGKKPSWELMTCFEALANKKCKSIKLCNNHLYLQKENLKSLFNIFSDSVESFDLSYNDFGRQNDGEELLAHLFSGLKPSVRKLKLSGNFIECWPRERLKILHRLPPTITTLDFSGSPAFYTLDIEQLCSFLSSIPKTVRRIKLQYNSLFEEKTIDERVKLFKALTPWCNLLDLHGDQEDDIASACVPMRQLAQLYQLPRELEDRILSYLFKTKKTSEATSLINAKFNTMTNFNSLEEQVSLFSLGPN
ncbi:MULTISPECIES: hypothetical protein [Legionella]|uniref:Leucine-rich repeat-containing protein (Substrate of the Dot/Icm secretion system) n=1 Tax=Legionella maceachernii TaxID=466 RepID=A0A0W0W6T1_9GAMM|nr:hypothetical protein [Legionella maceachernii]KTD28055.1 leucine-rich repeat-containing protein (substrate of the Dot/Icm secretion system) [Legionella maceachernii]SKA07686.1 hypothetical protein SAMN02745128_02004 [Legionella maceachernii]SUO99797.1 Uncharacterised protein [Legionella maceachernii]